MVCVINYFVTRLMDVIISGIQVNPDKKVSCPKVEEGGGS